MAIDPNLPLNLQIFTAFITLNVATSKRLYDIPFFKNRKCDPVIEFDSFIWKRGEKGWGACYSDMFECLSRKTRKPVGKTWRS